MAEQPLDLVFTAFARSIGEGDGAAEAAEKAAAEARKAGGVETVVVEKGGVGLEIVVKPAAGSSARPSAA